MMRTLFTRAMPSFLLLAAAGNAAAQQAAPTDSRWALFDTYCSECHNSTDWAGGVAFDTLTARTTSRATSSCGEHTVRKLRGHLMPPPGSKQPTQAEIDDLVGWLETSLDARKETPRARLRAAAAAESHRVRQAVRTLLGVEIKAEDLLPTEIEVDGFDNIAAALSVSPAFLEQYISVGAHRRATSPSARRRRSWRSVSFPPPSGDQDDYVDGMPLGTRGGMRFTHNFPADGEYRITITRPRRRAVSTRARDAQTRRDPRRPQGSVPRRARRQAKISSSSTVRARPARAKIMERFANIPVQVTGGRARDRRHVHRALARGDRRARSAASRPVRRLRLRGQMRVPRADRRHRDRGSVRARRACRGPRAATRSSSATPTGRERREPLRRADRASTSRTRAYPPAGDRCGRWRSADAVLRRRAASEPAASIGGIEQIVTAVLVEPRFPVSRHRAAAGVPVHGGTFALDDSSSHRGCRSSSGAKVPDDELLELAAAGKLQREQRLEAQVERMLADPRATTLVNDLRAALAQRRRARRRATRTSACSPSSATRCATISRPRSSCSSRACCSRTTACTSC